MPAILFVEDDATIDMGVEYSLKQDSFQASLADDRLEEARCLLKHGPFDLVLLDLGLPDGSGYELCKEIRAAGDMPVIILSARDEETCIVLGLDLGADDYLTKPFRLRELISRMKAVLRRRGPVEAEDRSLDCGDVTVVAHYTDPEAQSALITSAQKNVDVAVYNYLKTVVDGSVKAGTSTGTLQNGGIGLAPFHDWGSKIPADLKAQIQKASDGIKDGSIAFDLPSRR